jgi:hypothetical protein
MVTNEFDPARLKRACDNKAGNHPLFANVVHICPDALRAVYGESPEPTMSEVLRLIDVGRIISLDEWVSGLVSD